MCLMCALTLRGMALGQEHEQEQGQGQGVLEACERCQGKLHICQISKQVISANNSQKNSQSVSVLGSHTASLSSSSWSLVVVVVVVVVVSRSNPPTLRVLCAVCPVCARRLLLSIEKFNRETKKKNENKRKNPEGKNPVPCHAFLMKCRRLRNILWHDLIVVPATRTKGLNGSRKWCQTSNGSIDCGLHTIPY